MVRRPVDMQGSIIRFAEWLVRPAQVERKLETVGDLDASVNGNLEAEITKVIHYC